MRARSRFKSWALLGTTLACLMLSAGMARSEPAFDRRAWTEDYAVLKSELEKRYSHLAWLGSYQSGTDLPELDRRTQAWLSAARSNAGAEEALRAFVRGLGDEHVS